MLQSIMAKLTSIVCFVIAGSLALKDKPGWGWFIFAGIICFITISINEEEE